MPTDEAIQKILNSDDRLIFVSTLAFYLTIVARGKYVEAGQAPDSALSGLRANNEMFHSVTAQLMRYSGDIRAGFPEAAFWVVLKEKAQIGLLGDGLLWAADEALKQIGEISKQKLRDPND